MIGMAKKGWNNKTSFRVIETLAHLILLTFLALVKEMKMNINMKRKLKNLLLLLFQYILLQNNCFQEQKLHTQTLNKQFARIAKVLVQIQKKTFRNATSVREGVCLWRQFKLPQVLYSNHKLYVLFAMAKDKL